MADHTFSGHCPHTYPTSRDRLGQPVGEVEPTEIRDTNGPLDHMWHETTDEDRAVRAKILAEREKAARRAAALAAGEDVPDDEDEPPEDDEPAGGGTPADTGPPQDAPRTTAPPPAGRPQPAPPAVIP
jgi:hypothetical protein